MARNPGAVERVKVLEKALPGQESGIWRICRWGAAKTGLHVIRVNLA